MYIVSWTEDGTFKTMAFNDFWNADNWAASRSLHWGYSSLEGVDIYKTYKNGHEMKW